MLLPKRIANHYARAIADVAYARNQAEQVKNELETFAGLFAKGSMAHKALTAPHILKKQRRAALEKIIQRTKPLATTANTLRVLLKNDRIGHLEEINQALAEEFDRRNGIVRATIRTARKFKEDLQQEIIAALEKLSGKKISAVWEIEPDLIGGFRAKVANTIFDASIKGRLEALRQRLLAGLEEPSQ